MIQAAVKVSSRKAVKAVKDIQSKDIPTAQVRAGKRAAQKTATVARREIASRAGVAQKYLAKRFSTTGGTKARPRSRTTVRHLHLNPAGTKKYPVAISTTYKITKTGKRGKGHGQIKAMGKSYPRAFIYNNRGQYRVPIILQRTGQGRLPVHKVTIEIGQPAVESTKRAARLHGAKTYVKEFDRQLKARIRKRVSR
jgi:hypothetical protein